MHSQLMFAIGVLILTLAASLMIGQEPNRQLGLAEAQSANFLVYRDAVREYMLNHPGHTGTITESDLDLPQTYTNMGWSNQANAGEAWIYGDMIAGGLRRAVSREDNPINLGINESGVLVSPIYGNTGIPVPGFVSAGQVAAVVKNT